MNAQMALNIAKKGLTITRQRWCQEGAFLTHSQTTRWHIRAQTHIVWDLVLCRKISTSTNCLLCGLQDASIRNA